MGLNANYRLLCEDNKSAYHIPAYINHYRSDMLSEAGIMQIVVDFNQEIREAQAFLSDLGKIESMNESEEITEFVNGVSDAWSNVKSSTSRIKERLIDFITELIYTIKKNFSNTRDEIDDHFKNSEKLRIINQIMIRSTEYEKSIQISDITPTVEIEGTIFPDMTVIGLNLVNLINNVFNNHCKNESNEADYSRYVSNERDVILHKFFGNYNYDFMDISGSTYEVCKLAFGTSFKDNVVISQDTYNVACENLEDVNKFIKILEITIKDINDNYNALLNAIDNVSNEITKIYHTRNHNNDFRVAQDSDAKIITDRSIDVIKFVKEIVDVNFTATCNKANRIFDIINDSDKVKKASHNLINKYIGEEIKDTYYSGIENVKESIDEMDEFTAFTMMINEEYLEENFSGKFLSVIMEAESDTTSSTETPEDKTKENTANSKNSIVAWMDSIATKVAEAVKRMALRVQEFNAKNGDQKLWNKMKDGINKVDLSDTKVNQWFKFNVKYFENSTFMKFEINDTFKSDEALQEALIKKAVGTDSVPPKEEKESFSDRVKKIYQGEYINDENGEGKNFEEVGSKDDAYNFVDAFCENGFNADFCKNITADADAIKRDKDSVKNSYDTLARDLKGSKSIENAQNNAQNADNKQAEPKNEAAEEDEFNFNVAEWFGLPYNEASFSVGDATSASSKATYGADDGDSSSNKELNEMIRRCYNYNSIILTARMTSIMGAYKQYMGLFKAVYNSRKNKKEEKKEDQASNENQNKEENK